MSKQASLRNVAWNVTLTEFPTASVCNNCRTAWAISRAHIDRINSNDYHLIRTDPLSHLESACPMCQQILAICKALEGDITNSEQQQLFGSRAFKVEYKFDDHRRSYLRVALINMKKAMILLPVRTTWLRFFGHPATNAKIVQCENPDFKRIKRALALCHERHGDSCRSIEGTIQNLRVIDCKTRLLVPNHANKPYACLSYVWGIEPAETVTDKVSDRLPKTIEDAMRVALKLRIPYLWVDRYCIDFESKHTLIRQMDKIYGGAELCIIATCGNGPDFGLSGMKGTPRAQRSRLDLGGRSYVDSGSPTANAQSIPEFDYVREIHKSKWYSRGWTYQEMILSPRRLVFSATCMYFQCRTDYFAEYMWSAKQVKYLGKNMPDQVFPEIRVGARIEDLGKRIQEYWRRELSYSEDILDAFAGVFDAYNLRDSSIKITSFYGIPLLHQDDFDEEFTLHSLLSYLGWVIRMSGEHQSNLWSDLFPSWTWASQMQCRTKALRGNLDFPLLLSSCHPLPGVNVQLTDKEGGLISMSTFLVQDGDFVNMMPRLDITAPTKVMPAVRYKNGIAKVDLFGNQIILPQIYASKGRKFLAMFFSITQIPSKSYDWALTGLLVTETAPLLYSRVCSFSRLLLATRRGVSEHRRRILSPPEVTEAGLQNVEFFLKEEIDRWEAKLGKNIASILDDCVQRTLTLV